MKQLVRRVGTAGAVIILGACATAGGGPGGTVTTGPASPDQSTAASSVTWPVKTREHVDLWLHGFALLQEDTTFVPFFKRGYTTNMIVLKNRANVVTQLDANRDRLRARLAANPSLVNAQFVPLSFASWADLSQAVDIFVRADGNPRAASSQQQASAIAFLAAYFPTSADREWVRLFTQSLNDESSKFYHSYWTEQQRERSNVLDLVDTLWQRTYRPRMQRFLNNTQQANGEVLLSLPLDGEGRSLTNGRQSNTLTVTFPDRPNDAAQAIYVIAHEAVGAIASTAVSDNITPEQKRGGVGERYQSAAAVRGGALLLERTSPELLDGYMRYYLASVNRPVGGNLQSTFTATFSLPDTIRDALVRQLDVVLGGI
ncbi:MAG TPA: hypothetical protein VHL12_05685 [Gemmatimonadaceae bacterium]|jgi:hypothetical protein|nr:hypothetical protein [Gemmatimonadaceae bacterium]